jgi:DNA-binding transcriptional LysR family regulator
MNKFMAINVLVRVVESGGFTAAARKMGMSVSAVTKAIARLEDELGTQLFNRTTRQVNTTDYGQDFYERCVQILDDLEDAETLVKSRNVAAEGRIRAVVPFSFGRVTLVPALPSFYEQYPNISVELSFSDGPVDLVAEGYDVAVRTGQILDSRLTTRLLTRGSQITAASPQYLKKHGTPKTPDDLKDHNCIVGRFGPEWDFANKKGEKTTVRVSGNTIINSGDAYREAAVNGVGIIQGTYWLVRKDLESGALVQILNDYALEGAPISVLYLAKRHLPRKVRVFLDFIIALTKGP